jgi:EpsI family protein
MVFLSFILVLLFLLGVLFRDSDRVTQPSGHTPTGDQSDRASGYIRTGFFSIATVIAVSVPYLAAQWTEPRPVDPTVLLAPFKAEGAWQTAAQGNSTWRPDIGNADAELLQDFVSPHGQISLHVSYFSHQRQGAELVQEGNASFAAPPWRIVARSELPLRISQNTVRVPCATIDSDGPQRLACHIFWVNGTFTGSALTAKLYQAIGRLSFQSPAAAVLSFSWEPSPVPGDETKQVENLFQSLPPMVIWLRNVASQP